MSKATALQNALKASTQPAPEPAEDKAPGQPGRQPSRAGRWNLSAWVDPAYKRSLMLVRIKEDRTAQALICEAMNLLFEKHNVPIVTERDDG
jgi:hypothetical protein